MVLCCKLCRSRISNNYKRKTVRALLSDSPLLDDWTFVNAEDEANMRVHKRIQSEDTTPISSGSIHSKISDSETTDSFFVSNEVFRSSIFLEASNEQSENVSRLIYEELDEDDSAQKGEEIDSMRPLSPIQPFSPSDIRHRSRTPIKTESPIHADITAKSGMNHHLFFEI